jgi:hypothetical protein
METPIEIKSDDPILENIEFKFFGYRDSRLAKQFLPDPDMPQTTSIQSPWGFSLTAKRGDYIVWDVANPDDIWTVNQEIFEGSHSEETPGTGIFHKHAMVALVPLLAFTKGDPDKFVTIYTLEGPQTVPAGIFHLARGIKGEIWPFPSEKIEMSLYPLAKDEES